MIKFELSVNFLLRDTILELTSLQANQNGQLAWICPSWENTSELEESVIYCLK